MKNSKYERVEVTFSKNNEVEIDLFKYLDEKSKIIGKGTYLKQLLYEHMLKDRRLYEDTSALVEKNLNEYEINPKGVDK